MDSNEADPDVPESHAPSHHPEIERTMPSAPSSTTKKDDATDKAEQPDTAMRDQHKSPDHDSRDIGGQIQALKAKILELEQQVKVGPNSPTQESSNPQLVTEMEQYKRVEACLYRHRKEWEQAGGPGPWTLEERFNNYVRCLDEGPWIYKWDVRNSRPYNRPDPFDPSHMCADDQHDTESPLSDDFDHAIAYGARRERIRKNFEWEMDRLYLAEEIDLRKRGIVSDRPPKRAGLGTPLKGPSVLPKKTPSVEPNAKISRMDWFSFQRMGYVNKSSGSVVEILEGEPIIDNDINGYRAWYGSSGRRTRITEGTRDRESFGTMSPGQAPLPERIRVRSESIIKIINTILKRTTVRQLDVVVFIRPFKALVLYEHELRDWCRALERKLAGKGSTREVSAVGSTGLTPEASINSPELEMKQAEGPVDTMANAKVSSANDMDPARTSETDKEIIDDVIHEGNDRPLEKDKSEGSQEGSDEEEDDSEDPAKSPKALEHLRCLLSFIDSEIVTKRKYLSAKQCQKVFFSDLWLLFRPGMEVIGMDGKQAYRVIDVTSPKHRVDSGHTWLRWYNPSGMQRKQAPFSITCVYIDFDGKNLGPVQRVFDFRNFDGERDVTSLEVYPLHFHPVRKANFNEEEWKAAEAVPEAERYRHKLIHRGIKFLNVASVKHMYYAGPTLETREEVESQVVIDFETAFSMEDSTENWKPELNSVLGVAASVPTRPSGPGGGPMGAVGPAGPVGQGSSGGSGAFPVAPNLPPAGSLGTMGPDMSPGCNADCCRGQPIYDDSLTEVKQREEYVNSLLPKTNALFEPPPISIIPRPLKEMQTGKNGGFVDSEDELLIMPYRVFGFVLRNRKWAKLDLAHLTEIHPQKIPATPTGDGKPQQSEREEETSTAFDRLVLEKGHRDMIVSLVSQHFRDKESKMRQREDLDIVRGKGKGLILLLHGAPGVGKTSTAEGVAEMFKKPLIQITCGDLGTTAKEVETALETNFALANKWDCILLLDEADVFLAERNKEDFKRNGLVAVFLRVMEYYAGILFLTTNRVGDFDEAFTSRIHISLYYPELDQKKTADVFDINMKMIEQRFQKNGRAIDIDRVQIGRFAAQPFVDNQRARWNGRQIRNACQTALALAEFEAQGNSHTAILKPDAVVRLGMKHFEIVRDAYVEFTKYMDELHGTNAARRAKEARLRAMRLAEYDSTLGGSKMMDGTAFALASQIHPQQRQHQGFPQAPPPHYHQGVSPQVVHTQPQQEQPYYSYQNPAPQQSSYPDRSRMGGPPHNPAPDQYRSNVTGNMAYPSFDVSQQGYHQNYAPRQPSPMTTPTRQQEHPTNQSWLRDGIRSMYEPSGDRNPGQAPPGSVSPGPVVYTQGNPTWGPPRSQA